MYPCNCTESLQLQLWWFSCSYRSWGSTRLFYTEQITWPRAKKSYSPIEKREELLKIINVSLKNVFFFFFFAFDDDGFDSKEELFHENIEKGMELPILTKGR